MRVGFPEGISGGILKEFSKRIPGGLLKDFLEDFQKKNKDLFLKDLSNECLEKNSKKNQKNP